MDPGVKAGRVVVIEDKKKWTCGAVHQSKPNTELQRPLKEKLAQMALDRLKSVGVEETEK